MFRVIKPYRKCNTTFNAMSYCDVSSKPKLYDIPQPPTLPFFGTKLALLTSGGGSRLHEYIDKRHNQLGTIFKENLGSADIIFISDPVLIKSLFLNLEGKYPTHMLPDPWVLYEKLYGSKRGLFFMNGEEWLKNRRAVNKHLMREDSEKWLADPIKTTVSKFISNLKKCIETGNTKPTLESDLYRLSIDVLVSVLVGTQFPIMESHRYEELLDLFSQKVKQIFQTTTNLYLLPAEWYQKLNLKAWRDFEESVNTSLQLGQKIVQEMLNVKDSTNGLIKRMHDENIPDEIITRIVTDFVIAAGDTTSFTTLWTLLLLAKNEDVSKEIRIAHGQGYIKNVIKESMRLYPVAPFLTRILPKSSLLGPYTVEAGTPIVASIYSSGRDDKYFTNANKFLPYRWDRNDERRKELRNHEPSASLPFAMGARSCVGRKIAMIQLTEIIKQIVENFNISMTEDTAKVRAITSQVLVPNRSINLKFSIRQHEQ